MGFDVTAANVIFFIAALSVASVALGAYWSNASYVEEARRAEDDRAEERAQTNLTIVSASYDGGAARFTVDVKNMGPAVVEISSLAYFVDGALVASSALESVTVVDATTTTDLLLPLETLELEISPVASSPSYFQLVTAAGAKANWGS